MTNKTLFGLATITAFGACNKSVNIENKQADKPNIIFILADDLGYADLGCYGQKMIQTPNLDKMAKEGIRFNRHYAGATVSAPSRCCLMTGLHNGHSRVRGNAQVPLQLNDTTVAELLKTAGYKTALIGKWGLGEQGTSGIPNKKGFDFFYGYLNQIHAHNSYPEYLWRDTIKEPLKNKVEFMTDGYAKGIGGYAIDKKEYSNELFTKEALKYIKENKDNSFFLYLAYTIPHANNEAPNFHQCGIEVPDLGQYRDKPWKEVERAKASVITYLDSYVGSIVDLLKNQGMEKNTIVFFSSDNGPHQEGGVCEEFFNSNGSLQGIKRDLYEGGIREPMIVWSPSLIKSGQVSDLISAFWDFLPTACDLAGIPIPSWTDGISYAPTLFGKNQKNHEYLYWEFHEQGGKQAVLYHNWKGIRLNVDQDSNAIIQLFNLSEDISEQNCLTPLYPDMVKKIDSIMKTSHRISQDFLFDFEKNNRLQAPNGYQTLK